MPSFSAQCRQSAVSCTLLTISRISLVCSLASDLRVPPSLLHFNTPCLPSCSFSSEVSCLRVIMESILNQAKQLCPFIQSSSASTLRHLSTGRKNGKSLLTRAGYNCPVMRKALVRQSRSYVVPTKPVHARMPTFEQVHFDAGVMDTSRGMSSQRNLRRPAN